jgi:hypothetical protein
MWWTDDDFWLYRIEIEATAAPGGSVPLRLRPIVDGVDTMASP